MKVNIEKPDITHTEAIAAICAAGWRQTVEGVLSEAYIADNILKWYSNQKVKEDIKRESYTYIARIDDVVVGVIGGGITTAGIGEIYVLYVKEEHRYHGVGRKLLDALTEEQMEKGAKEQWVSVQEGNQRGIPFYESRGFIYEKKKVTTVHTGEEQVSLRYRRELIHN
ncbi:GNAT family N-acetyltransferase [Oceanobacillus piezotolerans]|uniref:GNAT family N-acetyltransferase n=1 Tax=Oceanobacillus piezotolerans TaxID=2448030 RepID=A0A498D6T3_9BACI|nr:GNAT family N-acetyltransferase [Oceanobacillus piezotolerans]RLL45458.1 GNAT family N-acetyltransferase [Oceanobacillus piezotolerans]